MMNRTTNRFLRPIASLALLGLVALPLAAADQGVLANCSAQTWKLRILPGSVGRLTVTDPGTMKPIVLQKADHVCVMPPHSIVFSAGAGRPPR